jgi:hypothetical protein
MLQLLNLNQKQASSSEGVPRLQVVGSNGIIILLDQSNHYHPPQKQKGGERNGEEGVPLIEI